MSSHPSSQPAMPPLPITLILAATSRHLGLGFRGQLPWSKPLKGEMAYFKRVTSRVVPPPSTTSGVKEGGGDRGNGVMNAVIMGRKTWESIPERFRPLKGRVNVVVSRSPEKLALPQDQNQSQEETVFAVGSIREGLDRLRERGHEREWAVARIFIIGGAEIYKAALEMRECERILFTSVYAEVECDVFFPVDLPLRGNGMVKDGAAGGLAEEGGEGGEGGGGGDGGKEWVRKSREELSQWVGEDVPEGRIREGEVEYEFMMFEWV